MERCAEAAAYWWTDHHSGAALATLAVCLLLTTVSCRYPHRQEPRRGRNAQRRSGVPRAERHLLRRLDAASRGLTTGVRAKIKLRWIRDHCLRNNHHHHHRHRCDQSDEVDVLGGALWFRFHVGADFAALQSVPETSGGGATTAELVAWALQPLAAQSDDISMLTGRCIDAILALDADTLPEVVVRILVDEVLGQHSSNQRLGSKIRSYLGFLNVLKQHETVGLVRVARIVLPHPLPRRSAAGRRFLERLDEARNDMLVRASLPRIYTNLGIYGKASALLQEAATADAYLRTAGRDDGRLLVAVETWINDIHHLMTSMEQGLVTFPRQFRKQALLCLSKSLVENRSSNVEDEDDVIFDRVEALSRVATHLHACNVWTEALDCLEQARDLLRPLFARCCTNVANSLWYLGIVYGTRNERDIGLRCLSYAKDLNKEPSADTLSKVLREVIQPFLLVTVDDNVTRTRSQRHPSVVDKGMVFSINQLRRTLRQIVPLLKTLANTLSAMAVRVEAKLARLLTKILVLAETLASPVDGDSW